jgi:hypothetical protein
MKKNWIVTVGALALIGCLSAAGPSFAAGPGPQVQKGTIALGQQPEADFPSLARIRLDEAAARALQAVKGQVLKIELENENDFLVYGVEVVKADKSITDVKIDAGSGKILALNQDKADDEDHNNGEDQDKGEQEENEEHGEHES